MAGWRGCLRRQTNAFIYQNNGMDLDVLGERVFDFAFSICCFHHIPSREVIENYIREVAACCGLERCSSSRCKATWSSIPSPMTLGSAFRFPTPRLSHGRAMWFRACHRVGAGEERFWLWFFKK